ncbi:MAG: hypothetical protein ACRCWC_07300, partial [Plesiomonas shigelloides]
VAHLACRIGGATLCAADPCVMFLFSLIFFLEWFCAVVFGLACLVEITCLISPPEAPSRLHLLHA